MKKVNQVVITCLIITICACVNVVAQTSEPPVVRQKAPKFRVGRASAKIYGISAYSPLFCVTSDYTNLIAEFYCCTHSS
jgi:hypothetical protein